MGTSGGSGQAARRNVFDRVPTIGSDDDFDDAGIEPPAPF
jgi:hypothetical protein